MLLSGPVAFFARAAILLVYLKLFGLSYDAMRWFVYAGLAFAFVAYWSSIPLAVVTVAPTKPGHSWLDSFTIGKGYLAAGYAVFQAAASVLIDLYIFVLPLPILLRMNLSLSKRLQLAALFGTALVAVAASILSLVYRTRGVKGDVGDTTWDQSWSFFAW